METLIDTLWDHFLWLMLAVTGGSQFFIVHEPQPHLDGVHTVFGKATSGIETVLNMRQGDVMKEVKVWEE